MSSRLEILEASLQKKQKLYDDAISDIFDDVKRANGQPLNDKKNGRATLNRWERKNNAIRNKQAEIEKTERAIQKEKKIIANMENTEYPEPIKKLIDAGELIVWRKFPNYFFVNGIEKARISIVQKGRHKGKIAHSYINELVGEDRKKFASIFNNLQKDLAMEKSNATN